MYIVDEVTYLGTTGTKIFYVYDEAGNCVCVVHFTSGADENEFVFLWQSESGYQSGPEGYTFGRGEDEMEIADKVREISGDC